MLNYTFINREFFYLLIIPIGILIWYILKHKSIYSNILFSDTSSISKRITLKQKLRHLPYLMKILASILLIIAIARPQSLTNWEESTTQGIDIILAMDISGSMLARDLKPDRLEASKNVAIAVTKIAPDAITLPMRPQKPNLLSKNAINIPNLYLIILYNYLVF